MKKKAKKQSKRVGRKNKSKKPPKIGNKGAVMRSSLIGLVLARRLKRNSLDFIETELRLARTFRKRSKETDDLEIRTRNVDNAQRAFQAAVKTFKDFREQTEDWRKAKAALDDVERELNGSR